ncbi:hypothetical protein ACFLIM_39310 [Nonomuraea sp. M3C6]|uniref:Uncharacterized protein n=1 Tax=Nonomuraea marmarensis TaxID=3351344 RepID=A0ABW7AQE7_9ACTN
MGTVTDDELDQLRTTYPGWDIDRERDFMGGEWGAAELRQPLTQELVDAGVVKRIRRSDAVELSSTLAWQSALVHRSPWPT